LRSDGDLWLAQGATPLLAVKELPLAGLHNAANALAALALTRALGESYPPLLTALRDFKGCRTGWKKVAEFDGVAYYDDSKGTNVGSTVAALNGFAELGARGARVVLIAGGEGKGQNFAPLAEPVSRHARGGADRARCRAHRARSGRERRCLATRRQHGGGSGASPCAGAARRRGAAVARLRPASTCSATTRTVAKCTPHA